MRSWKAFRERFMALKVIEGGRVTERCRARRRSGENRLVRSC